ncbi:MAG: hypothetical protein ACYTFW_18485 [Planctomycetota bacterium]
MQNSQPSKIQQLLAKVCGVCPVCIRARNKQRGLAYWLVKNIDHALCPFCRAYEKVHGRKSYQPTPGHGH